MVQIVNNYLLAYTALGLVPPAFPTEAVNWPSDGVFIAVDTALIAVVANKAVAGAASDLPHVGFNEGPFTGDLGLSLSQLDNVDVSDDGSIVSPKRPPLCTIPIPCKRRKPPRC